MACSEKHTIETDETVTETAACTVVPYRFPAGVDCQQSSQAIVRTMPGSDGNANRAP